MLARLVGEGERDGEIVVMVGVEVQVEVGGVVGSEVMVGGEVVGGEVMAGVAVVGVAVMVGVVGVGVEAGIEVPHLIRNV